MSEQLRRAADRIFPLTPEDAPASFDPFDPTRPAQYLAVVREAVNRLAWGTMTYACQGRDPRKAASGEYGMWTPAVAGSPPCGFQWDVWLAFGVEGPPDLKGARLFIPSPFFAGRCPICDGAMQHVDFPDDVTFQTPTLMPDDVPRFVLPDIVGRSDEGARLEVPGEAIVQARMRGAEA